MDPIVAPHDFHMYIGRQVRIKLAENVFLVGKLLKIETDGGVELELENGNITNAWPALCLFVLDNLWTT